MNRLRQLEARLAAGQADPTLITISEKVWGKAHKHEIWVAWTSEDTGTQARVKSATSGSVYNVRVLTDGYNPTFPYVISCECRWARKRLDGTPCSHAVKVLLERKRMYD